MRARREEAALTQQELADEIGGVRSSIQFLEFGKQTPTAKTIILIAEAIGVEPEEMFAEVVSRMRGLEEREGGPGMR